MFNILLQNPTRKFQSYLLPGEEWCDIIEEGASEEDLSILPKYRFRLLNNEEKDRGGVGLMFPTETSS
ncbi:hypothetical protein RYX36_002355 [Vicia faba]